MPLVILTAAASGLGHLIARHVAFTTRVERLLVTLLIGLCAAAVLVMAFGSLSLTAAHWCIGVFAALSFVWGAHVFIRATFFVEAGGEISRTAKSDEKAQNNKWDRVPPPDNNDIRNVASEGSSQGSIARPSQNTTSGDLPLLGERVGVRGLPATDTLSTSPFPETESNDVGGRTTIARFDWIERIALCAIVFSLTLTFVAAFAPVTSWDAAVAHLALPAAYVDAGRIGLLDGNNYSAYPHLLHVLYTFVFREQSESLVNLTSWIFAALAIGFVYCAGARLAGRKAGLVAGAILATAPIFAEQAGVPTIDLAFACTVAASILALIAWRQDTKLSWLMLAAAIAGSGCGIRHTGYLVVALIALALLAIAPNRRLRTAVVFAGIAAVAASPWMLRSTLLVGNPVYPFFATSSGSAVMADVDAASIGTHDSIRARGFVEFIQFPWSVVMRPDRFDGWAASPGGLVIVLGVLGAIVAGRRGWWLAAFSIAGIAAMFFFRQHARYLLPFFVPMMILAGVAAAQLRVARVPVAAVVVVSLLFGLTIEAAALHFKIPVAVGLESRSDYLAKRIERYAALEWVRDNLSNDGVVLTLDPRGYYVGGACYQNFEGLKALVGADAHEQSAWLTKHGIDYLLYPEDYVRNSPGFRETGVQSVIDGWRSDQDRFELVKRFELDRTRSAGKELVEIYRVQPTPRYAAFQGED